MVITIRFWGLLNLTLSILDDRWIEEGVRFFRLALRICQKTVLDVHLARHYRALWLFNKCLVDRWAG